MLKLFWEFRLLDLCSFSERG